MRWLPTFMRPLWRGIVGVVIGGACGSADDAPALGFTSWLRESPEEPAWVSAGAALGLSFGTIGGAALGFIVGLFTALKTAPDADDTRGGVVDGGAKV